MNPISSKTTTMSATQINFLLDQDITQRFDSIINSIIDDKYIHGGQEFEFYQRPCKEAYILLDFMEKYYDVLRNEKTLAKIYYSISKCISILIERLKNQNECTCHLNTRPKWAIFLDEFYDLDELRAQNEVHANSMANYGGYEDRNTYRLYNLNFLCMRPRPELKIFIDSPFHDFELVTRELIHWKRYFDQHNVYDLKKINKILYNKTVNDCIQHINKYLYL